MKPSSIKRTTSNTPASNTRWIHSRKDLDPNVSKAKFRITKPTGKSFEIVLRKRQKQTLQAIMIGPVYCASVIRLGEYVSHLKHKHGVDIKTDWYRDKDGGLDTRYGTYTLKDDVEYLGEVTQC